MFHYKEIDPSCFYSHSNKTQNDIQRVPMKTNDCFLIRSLKNYDPSIQTNNDVLYLVPEYNTSNSNNTILTIHKLDSSFQSQLDPSKSVVNIHDQLNIQSGYEPQINERRNPGNLDQIYRITNGQQRYITEIKLYLYNNRIMNSEHLNDSISEGISYVKAIPCKIIHSQGNYSPKVHYPQDISPPFVSATNSVSVSFTLPSLKAVEDRSNAYKDSYRYSTKQLIGIQFKLFEQTQALKEIVIQTTYNDMETCFQAKKSKYSSEKTFVSLNEQQSNDGSFSSKQTPNQGTYNQGESNSLNDNRVNYVNQRGEFDNVDTIDIDNRTYVCSYHHFCCLSEQTNSTFKSVTQRENHVKHEDECMEQFKVDNYSNNNTLTFKKWDENSQFPFNIMNVDSNKQSCRSNDRNGVVYCNTKKGICYDSMMDEGNVTCTSSLSERKTNSNSLVDNLSKRDSQDAKSYILHRWLQEQLAYSTERDIFNLSDKIPSLKVNRSPTSLEYQILNSVDSKHSILSKDIIEKETKFSNVISPSVGSLSSSSSFTLSMSHIDSISERNDQSNKYYTTKSQYGLSSSKEKYKKLFNSSPCGSSTFTLHNERSKRRKPPNILLNSLSSSSNRAQSKSNSFPVNSSKLQTHLSNHYVIDNNMDQQSNQRRLSSIPKNQSLDKTTEMLTSTRRSNYLTYSSTSKNHFLDKTAEISISTRRSNYLTYSNADPFTINKNSNDLKKVFELDPYDDLIKSYYNTTDRRIKSISIKTNCIIQINGPFTTFYKHANNSSIVNLPKIKYQCHIYGFNEKMLEKCINFIKETFPNSLLHFL